MLARLHVHIEQFHVCWQPAAADSKQETSLSDMVQVGGPQGQLHRMVEREEVHTHPQPYMLRAHKGLGNQQVRGVIRLPRCGEVLPDPSLAKPQLVSKRDAVEVPLVRLVRVPLRWVRRHQE